MTDTTTTSDRRVIAIVGPTAVGKSAIAEHVALQLGGEVVSADSMQVYRGMDIGTAKTPSTDRSVPLHCVDIADPGTPFSAAVYQLAARGAIDDILGRGLLPVVCGGTGLYVRAALDDFEFPTGDGSTPARQRLEALAADIGPDALHARLSTVDPSSAARIHPNNVRRTIRALEMAEEGTSYADQAERFSVRTSVYDTAFIGIAMDRDELYARIDARVNAMMEAGLLDEVRRLLDAGYRHAVTATQAIGYKELVPVLEQGASQADAVASIKQATRRYAKRQLTWLRADPRVVWLDVTELSPAESAAHALDLVESLLQGSSTPTTGQRS